MAYPAGCREAGDGQVGGREGGPPGAAATEALGPLGDQKGAVRWFLGAKSGEIPWKFWSV